VPGKMISLLPTQPNKPNDAKAASAAGAPGAPAAPRFGTPTRYVSEGFWSNLKQFLTERPIKIRSTVTLL
jgi:hypothetical protein